MKIKLFYLVLLIFSVNFLKSQNKINYSKINLELINSGVSGETSTGLLNRFKWVLEEDYDAVIISIGANDALRGINPIITYRTVSYTHLTLPTKA